MLGFGLLLRFLDDERIYRHKVATAVAASAVEERCVQQTAFETLLSSGLAGGGSHVHCTRPFNGGIVYVRSESEKEHNRGYSMLSTAELSALETTKQR